VLSEIISNLLLDTYPDLTNRAVVTPNKARPMKINAKNLICILKIELTR
jgi:hypothetical protein